MRKQDDDAYSPIDSKFESYYDNPEELDSYLEVAKEFDIIAFYKYTIKRIEELRDTNSENLRIYWLVSNKLKETSAVKSYLNGEVKDEDINNYRTRENIEITQILKALENKKKKTPLQRFTRFLKG